MKYYINRPKPDQRQAQVSVISDNREEKVEAWEGTGTPEYQIARTGYVMVRTGREEPNFGVYSRPLFSNNGDFARHEDGRVKTETKYSPVHEGTAPTQLFTHHSPVIEEAFVDPSLRHAVPTMIGMAMKAVGAEHDTPTASNDLSEWSSRLSQKAAARGLAKGHKDNPNMGTTNNIDMSAQRVYMFKDHTGEYEKPFRGSEEATPEEVSSARAWVRDRISASRGTPSRPQKPQINRGDSQFEQLKLF